MKSKKLFLCLLAAAFTLTPVCGAYAAAPQITAGNGEGSILIKYDDDMTSVASGDKTIAIGQQVTANGNNSIAIGDNVTANQGIAIGYNGTTSTGDRALAIGNNVTADGDDSIAIGNNVTANKGIAIGFGNTTATSSEAIAIGSNAQATRGIAIGRMAEADNQHSLALGFSATAKENQSTAVGAYAEAQDEKATAIGYYANAMGENTTALGGMTYAYKADNIAIGANVTAGSDSIWSNDKDIVAVGVGLDVEGGESTVVGSNSADYKKYYARDGVSGFGYDVNLSSNYSSAFGHSASVGSGADYAVALGSDSEATEAYTVSIGNSTTQRRLVNLSAGINDTDAVNVSQLKNITGVDWKFDADGNVTDGGFTIKGSTDTFKTIQDSDGWKFEATNDVTNNGGNSETSAGSSNIGAGDTLTLNGGKNIEISSDGNDKYTINMKDNIDVNSVSVGGKINISSSGINTGGADITTGGGNIDMGGGRITNVAGGAIAQGSTDAVNGGQLWDAYQRFGTMENNIYREMDDLREDVNVVGAHAAALSGLHPIDYNPYEPTTLSAAVGTYRDEYAVAVGVFHYTRENVMFNLGASLCSDGDIMGRAGVSFTVGKSSDKPKVAGTMNGLRNQVIAMQAKLDELEKQNARNEDIIRQNMELIRELKAELDAKR